MSLSEYISLIELVVDRVPEGHWVIPVCCLLLLLRLVAPNITWAIKFEAKAKESDKVARKAKYPGTRRGKPNQLP